jgi:O-antigen/teichoic acid export membrane protein
MQLSNILHGISWNFGSFVFLSITGIVLNLIVVWGYDFEVLGIFNQAFAYYIVASQCAVFGLHYACLHFVSKYHKEKEKAISGLLVSIALVIPFCLLAGLFTYFIAEKYAYWVNSPGLAKAIKMLTVGTVLFPLNKVLLVSLNGLQEHKLFAIGNSIRPLIIILGLIISVVMNFSGYVLTWVFSASELILLSYLLFVLKKQIAHIRWPLEISFADIFKFGWRVWPSGILTEANTRIDILMLGFFMTDTVVGLYSISAMVAEGMYQLLVVLRYTVDPLVAIYYKENNKTKLYELFKTIKKYSYIFILLAGILAIVSYPYILPWIVGKSDVMQTWLWFAILLFGIMVAAGYIPFFGIFQQSGFPGLQSSFLLLTVLVNVFGNLLLIPMYGATGAACATAIAYVSQACFFIFFVNLVLKLKLF